LSPHTLYIAFLYIPLAERELKKHMHMVMVHWYLCTPCIVTAWIGWS